MNCYDRWDVAVSAEGGGCCREICSVKNLREVDRNSVDLASLVGLRVILI